jgi:low molecular weight protein-tyrosine phosphatase
MSSKRCSVLFVCLGNICRSPLAEGVFLHHLEAAGLLDSVKVDSAGTGAWHVGERPDGRSIEVAQRHGIELPGRARRVTTEDFHDFDHIYAMDGSNLRDLELLEETSGGDARIELFRSSDPDAGPDADVPDPYYGRAGGFDRVFEMVDRTCRVIVAKLVEELE